MNPIFLPVFQRAIHIGPLTIHFYALAYIIGLLLGWRLVRYLVRRPPLAATALQVDDFLTWATLGIILGGRLGYVLFYQPAYYFTHPTQIVAVWDGGMSFHGGFLGVAIAIIWFCRKHHIKILAFADRIAVAVPIGLFLGRCANFINGELWGRPAPAWFPFAMVYPEAGPQPRYPSELIEAVLEGVVLFIIMLLASRSECLRRRAGTLAGIFVTGYGIARTTAECFRQPDWFLGYLQFGITMGQLLSIPMIFLGIAMIWYAGKLPRLTDKA
jgi:phosphatidylglycerol:prolipoprotein diacylglycerol transferase